jgi:hypothetical protein
LTLRIPQRFAIAISALYITSSFYIFYTPQNFFVYLNAQLLQWGYSFQLPLPFENSWAFVYAAIPAALGFYVQYQVAHGVKRGEG